MQSNKYAGISKLIKAAGLGCGCLGLLFLLGATEINIGVNNQVNTGKIVGGNCLQGNGNLTAKKLTVDPFKEIAVEGIFTVNITCGQQSAVTITADQNLHPLISAVVRNGRLSLSTTGSYCTTESFVANISLPELASISADGSSEFTVACESAVSGNLAVDLRGTSSMLVSGAAKSAGFTLRDSTEIDAYQFMAENVSVKASDAATVRVYASKKLSGQGSDASEIHYRGQPATVKVSTLDASECSPDD